MSYASKVQKKAIPGSQHKYLTPGRWIIYFDAELGKDVTAICTSNAQSGTRRLPRRVNCIVVSGHKHITTGWYAPLDQIKVLGDKIQYSGPTLLSNQKGIL